MAKNSRDLAKQMFASKTSYVSKGYADATREPHLFALVDTAQQTLDKGRIVGNFASRDRRMIVYVPR